MPTVQSKIIIQHSQIHPILYHKIMKHLASMDDLVEQSEAFYHKNKVPEAVAKRLQRPCLHHIDRTQQWLSRPNTHLISHDEPLYPQQLKELPCHPPVLSIQGNHTALSQTSIGVVGSRNASYYGLSITKQFVQSLTPAGLSIISGLAIGIDATAHSTCIDNQGVTIAIIGLGLDQITPRGHQKLARQIQQDGCIMTEMPLGSIYHHNCFPRRNRLISALSNALLIPEASIKSGTLITAHYAIDLHRPVLVIPGRIDQPQAMGCLQLIQDGAHLVISATDCLAIMNREYPHKQYQLTMNEHKIRQ